MTADQPDDADDLQEDPSRPFESWLHDYLSDPATVNPLGPLGAKCRDAADELVADLLAHAHEPAARARFTRSLSFMILDSYLRDGWDTYES